MKSLESRRLKGFVALGAVLVLQGCAGIRIYHAADDEAAKTAKSAIVAADLKNALVPERLAMQEFKKREQDAVRRNQYSLRDSALVSILSATDSANSWGFLENQISMRRATLLGKAGTSATSNEIETAIRQSIDAQGNLDPLRQTYLLASAGKVTLECPLNETQRPQAAELIGLYSVFEHACNDFGKAKARTDALEKLGGDFFAASKDIGEIKAAQARYQADLKTAQVAYENALELAKATNPTDSKLEQISAKLKSSFDSLGSIPPQAGLKGDQILGRLLDAGKLAQIKKRTEAIDGLIQSLNGVTPSDASAAQKRLAAISGLEKAVTTETPLPVSALILEAEFLKLEARGLEKQIARGNEHVALLEKRRAAMEDEIFFLNEADKAFRTFQEATSKEGRKLCPAQVNLYDTFRAASPNCKFLLAEGLSAYVNSMTLGRTEQELIDYQIIAQGHDAVLDDSETALAQTEALMTTPVDQLSKIYAGGIKSEDLANLINALGLSAIAARVK